MNETIQKHDFLFELIEMFKALDYKKNVLKEPLTTEERESWLELKNFLHLRLQKKPGNAVLPKEDDHREFLRVPVTVKATFLNGKDLADCYLKNISGGGVFIDTDNPPLLDSIITLRIFIKEKGIDLTVSGCVVWVNEKPSKESSFGKGVGVKFVGMSITERKIVNELVNDALVDQLFEKKS